MSLAKDVGFILRKIPFSESSFILKAFTREHGPISFIAKGAKRPGSKLRGLLEPVLHLQFLFPSHSRSELRTLSEVSLLSDFPGLRADPRKQGLAQVFGEILLRYHPGSSDAGEFHDLLLASENNLESVSSERSALQAQLCAFLLRFCRASGFQPQFKTCVRCGVLISGSSVAFVMDQGGPVCANHREEGMHLLRESLALWLDALQNGGEAPEAGLVDAWRSEIFLLNYLGRHAGGEKKLQSLPVWHAITAEDS